LGEFAPSTDGGKRWEKYFSHHLRPWKENHEGYALLIGQKPRDVSLDGKDIRVWLQETTNVLNTLDQKVVYRPHPLVRRHFESKGQSIPTPKGAILSNKTLENDLTGAAYSVIYSSNTAVESVLSGTPAFINFHGSIAYPMGSENLAKPFFYPDRTRWCHDLAWKQFTLKELSSGFAWDHIRTVVGL
jgi:hypothetical protein